MSLRKLIITLVAAGLLAGAGVAVALAGSPPLSAGQITNAPTTTSCEDSQGEDEETEAADEVDQTATKVQQEAGREQADDEDGDDQPGEHDDEQGENDDCDD